VTVRRATPGPPAAAAGPRAGLSLLEVLVALAIFLFSIVALGQLIDIGSQRAIDVEWLARGSALAQSKLSEVSAGVIPLSSSSDTACDDDPDWTWSMDAEGDTTPNLYRVKITVSRQRPDGSRFETAINTYVFDPLQRGNTDGSATGSDDTTGTGTTGTTGTSTTGGP
jgi:general secretion pathway protein I